jgi:hypothetical protein
MPTTTVQFYATNSSFKNKNLNYRKKQHANSQDISRTNPAFVVKPQANSQYINMKDRLVQAGRRIEELEDEG